MKRNTLIWCLAGLLGCLVFFPICGRIGLALSRSVTEMTPYDLAPATRPLTVVACNEMGLILRDATAKLYTYSRQDWISQIAFKQNFKPGDIFCP